MCLAIPGQVVELTVEAGRLACHPRSGCVTCSDEVLPVRVVEILGGASLAVCEDDTGARSEVMTDLVGPLGAAHGNHTLGAARSVHQLDVLGQQVVDAVAADRVRVPCAHLHDSVVSRRIDGRCDLLRHYGAQASPRSSSPAWAT